MKVCWMIVCKRDEGKESETRSLCSRRRNCHLRKKKEVPVLHPDGRLPRYSTCWSSLGKHNCLLTQRVGKAASGHASLHHANQSNQGESYFSSSEDLQCLNQEKLAYSPTHKLPTRPQHSRQCVSNRALWRCKLRDFLACGRASKRAFTLPQCSDKLLVSKPWSVDGGPVLFLYLEMMAWPGYETLDCRQSK